MMRLSMLILVALGAALSGCGGDDGAGGEPRPVKELVPEKAPDQTGPGEAPPKEAVADPAEARRKAQVQAIQERLAATDDGEDIAELLARAKELGEAAQPLWPQIEKAAQHAEPFTRVFALETAGKVDPVRARPLIEKALKDEDREVREAAARAWVAAGIKELDPILSRVPDELEPQVQLALMVAVEKLGEKYHVMRVQEVLGDLDSNSLKPAVRFLVAQEAKELAPRIADFLERNDPDLRILVARGLGQLGDKSKPVLEALARALTDDALTVRQAAIETLRSLTGEELGYEPDASEEARRKGADEWREWIAGH